MSKVTIQEWLRDIPWSDPSAQGRADAADRIDQMEKQLEVAVTALAAHANVCEVWGPNEAAEAIDEIERIQKENK